MSAKFLVKTVTKFEAFRLGLKRKNVTVKNSFVYSYMERGSWSHDKNSLLLVHGYSADKFHFLQLMKFIPKNMHVVMLDLPGHGDTPQKKDEELNIMMFVHAVHEFVQAVELDKSKFNLLGESMGGGIVGLYAAEYPDQLKSLSLICPLGIHHEKLQAMMDEWHRTNEFVLLPQNVDEMKHMMDTLMYNKPDIPNVFISGLFQMRQEKNDYYKSLGEALIAPESLNLLEKNLHKINTPTLLLWGTEDQILDVECAKTIQKNLPSPPQKTVLLDEVGHDIFMEVPAKSAQILLDFLNSFSN